MAILYNMRPGQGFIIKPITSLGETVGISGMVLGVNDCEVKVRWLREGMTKPMTQGWSPHTEVIPANVTINDEPENGAATFACPCGQVCTSKSGLTLHQKSCPHVGAREQHFEKATEELRQAATPVELVCACGRRCTTTSGLTLHKQRCSVAQQVGVTNAS